MGQQLHIVAKGLNLDPNPLAAPPGSLSEAQNVVIKRPGVIEPRVGIVDAGAAFLTEGDLATASVVGIFPYAGSLVIALRLLSGAVVLYGGAGTQFETVSERRWIVADPGPPITATLEWAPYELATSSAELRSVTSRGNLYITTDVGVLRILGYAPRDVTVDLGPGAPSADELYPYAMRAGLRRPRQSQVDFTSTATTAAGVANHPLTGDGAYALRCCRLYKAGDITVRSAPSGRGVVRWSLGGATRYVAWDLHGGFGVGESEETAGDAQEMYRTTAFAALSTDTPNDEMALIATLKWNDSEQRDETPESGPYGEALYTNETEKGPLFENGIPPFCVDIAELDGIVFFAGATWAPRLAIDVTAIGPDDGPSGYDPVVDGLTYRLFPATSTLDSDVLTGVDDDDALYIRERTRLVDAGSADPTAADVRFPADTYVLDQDRVPVDAGTVTVDKDALSTALDTFAALDWIELEWVDSVDGTQTHRVFCWTDDDGTLTPNDQSAFDSSARAEGGAAAVHFARRLSEATGYDIIVTASKDDETKTWSLLFEGYEPTLESITVRVSNDRAIAGFVDGQYETTVERDGSGATIAWTPIGEPEHNPTTYREIVGTDDKDIERAIPTRDSLFIFKEDGVFRMSGTADSMRISEFDRSIRLVHPSAACSWNGAVACWTNRGVLIISDGGVQEIGAPIASVLREKAADIMAWPDEITGGVFLIAWESEETLLLGVPAAPVDGYAEYVYCYNARTGAWTRWTHRDAITCAAVDGATLYFGTAGIEGEPPKILGATDSLVGFDDIEEALVLSVDGNVVTVAAMVWDEEEEEWEFPPPRVPLVGEVIVGGSGTRGLVTASEEVYVSEVEYVVELTLDQAIELNTVPATYTVLLPAPVVVGWVAEDGANPGAQHFWKDAQLSFGGSGEIREIDWIFSTDRHPTEVTHTQDLRATTESPPAAVIKRIPRAVRTGTRIFIECAIRAVRCAWDIHALSVRHDDREPRARRGVLT
jgi:hypothetical protein